MSKLFGFQCQSSSPNADSSAASQAGGEKGASKHVLVHISGNRASWEHQGIHGALWRINPEKAGLIFSYDTSDTAGGGGGSCLTEQSMQERVSRALIKKITIVESSTNIDEVVSVNIDGIPPKEYTGNGDGASLFLMGSGRVTDPQEIFNLSGNTELGMAWMKQYPQYTNANLDVEGVMFLTGATYYFVHEGHPAIHMLKANQEQLGVQIRPDTLVDGTWYKVDTEAFIFCVKALRENILQIAPSTFNLSTLTVRIGKPDGQRWLHLPPQVIDTIMPESVSLAQDSSEHQEAKIAAIQRYIDKPLFLTLRLSIEYTLPETSNAGGNNNNNNSSNNNANTNTNNNNNNAAASVLPSRK
jgi:hypothetical protein